MFTIQKIGRYFIGVAVGMYVLIFQFIFYSFILCSIWVPILIHFDFNLRVDPPRPR